MVEANEPEARSSAERTQFEVEAAAWTEVDEVSRKQIQRLLPFASREGRVWRAQVSPTNVARLGSSWVRHPTRSLRPRPRPGLKMECWWEEASGACVCWRSRTGELWFLGDEHPGSLECGVSVRSGSVNAVIQRWSAGDRPLYAQELFTRATFGHENRPGLLVAAGATLRVATEHLEADRLRMALGVVTDPRDDSDVAGELRVTVQERTKNGAAVLWEGSLTAADEFAEVEVGLRDLRGRSLDLDFVVESESGAAGFVFFGDLRVLATPDRGPERPHVILLDIDTLRADRLGIYGHHRDTSPAIDRWAEECAIVYEDVVSPSNWTLPATVSMLTGLAVLQHGVVDRRQAIPASLTTLASRLRDAGYETLARTDGGFLDPTFGFAAGFDRFVAYRRSASEHQEFGWTEELEWLRERGSERPVFLFLQTYQVHAFYPRDRRFLDPDDGYRSPWEERPMNQLRFREVLESGDPLPNEDDWRYVNASYDAGVRNMDDVVGAFLRGLDEVLGDAPRMVILTSDHGDEINDHGGFGHGHNLYRELLFVPLIVQYPDGRLGRRDEPVSTLDIVPTVLDCLGLEVPSGLAGQSLLRPVARDRVRVAEHADRARALVHENWKLIDGTIDGLFPPATVRQLFHTDADPTEQRDLNERETKRAEQLVQLWEEFQRTHPRRGDGSSAEVGDDLRGALEALGYAVDEQ